MKRLRPSEESIREIIGGHYNNSSKNKNIINSKSISTTPTSQLIVVGVGGRRQSSSPGSSILYTAQQNSGTPSSTTTTTTVAAKNNKNLSTEPVAIATTTVATINPRINRNNKNDDDVRDKNSKNVALSSSEVGGLKRSGDIAYKPPPSCFNNNNNNNNNSNNNSSGDPPVGGCPIIGLSGSGSIGSGASSSGGIVVATMPSATNAGSTAVTAGANRSPAMAMQQLSQIRAGSALSTSNAVAAGASPPTAISSGNNTMQQQQQQQNDNMPPQPQQSPGGTNFQRLKVEDALSYLDLVKFKFGSKPQVYNDFLDIMKEFKSQSIDTPGVIQRVSNLFRGFPDLIKGFNTFLPPGYKIEVQDDGQDYNFQVSGPGLGISGVVGGGSNLSGVSSGGGGGSGGPGSGGGGRGVQEGGQTMIMRGSGTINNNMGGGGSSSESVTTTMTTMQAVSQPLTLTPIQQQQPQQQQHSNLSSSQLQQQVTITTSGGGSADVNASLQGHGTSGNTGGSTTTAGGGTSGRAAAGGNAVPYNAASNNTTAAATANQLSSMQQAAQQAQAAAVSNLLHQANNVVNQHPNNNNNNSNVNIGNSSSSSAGQQIMSGVAEGGSERGSSTTATQNQPVQFNHAINYVNKIKNRFQDQPEKYKRFLDILHIYQKEQRTMKESSSNSGQSHHHSSHHNQSQMGGGANMCMSIGGGGTLGGTLGGKHLTEQEVYSQVAKLFENQSDLLAEFGQFLPDATSHMNNNSNNNSGSGNSAHHHQHHQNHLNNVSRDSGGATLGGGNLQHNNSNNGTGSGVIGVTSVTSSGGILGAGAGNALLLAGQQQTGVNANNSSLVIGGGSNVEIVSTVKTNKQVGGSGGGKLPHSSVSGGYNSNNSGSSSRDGPGNNNNNNNGNNSGAASSSFNNNNSSGGRDLGGGYNMDNNNSTASSRHHHQSHHNSSAAAAAAATSSYHNISTSISERGAGSNSGHHNKSASGSAHHHHPSSTSSHSHSHHSSSHHSHHHHHHGMSQSQSGITAANSNNSDSNNRTGDLLPNNTSSPNNAGSSTTVDGVVRHRTGSSSGLHVKRSPSYATLLHGGNREVPPSKKHRLSGSAGGANLSSNLGGGSSSHHHQHHSSSASAAINANASEGVSSSRTGRDSSSTVTCRDVTLAEAAKYASLNEYTFFDQVHKAVKSRAVYNNFLRCLVLFNMEIVSKSELLTLATTFLGKFPELMRWFREFLGNNSSGNNNNSSISGGNNTTSSLPTSSSRDGLGGGGNSSVTGGGAAPYHHYFSHSSYPAYHHNNHNNSHHGNNNMPSMEVVPYNAARIERPSGELALEIDLTTAKRLGASYCVIPPMQEGMSCSGRTQLCKEVLNDQWVSFPTWSEDSTFVSSRKTQYEEYMYRCEDERFELDVVIETNSATIRYLEAVHKKLSRMSPEDVAKYRLDECLGGSSPVLQQRAVRRIYGDKAQEIIDGLKRNPAVAVPVVLRRLKAKEEEWRESQKTFNKIWREHNEKFYLKSLDHQGINFKQTDVKALRSKSLFNEIETLFDERHEQNEEGTEPIVGPHLILPYKDRTILDDAANLLIHHVKRQTGIQKGEKRRIKHLLRQFVPELFFHPKQQLTDDEREDDDEKDEGGEESPNSSPNASSKHNKMDAGSSPSNNKFPGRLDGGDPLNDVIRMDGADSSSPRRDEDVKVPLHAQTNDPDEAYTLFMANNNWYIFLRLHAILCERLAKIYERAVILAEEEASCRSSRKESTAIALRLKPKPQIEIEDYYMAFLDMVKNLLDGNMDANTYEDTLREMFGIHAYVAFTLDKVVSYAVRQLQHCVTERTATACLDLYFKEQKRGATGGNCLTAHRRAHVELAYQRLGERTVQDENCFKIYVYKNDCRMTIELLDTENNVEQDVPAVAGNKVEEAKKWSQYKERYADCGNIDKRLLVGGSGSAAGLDSGAKQRSPLYLERNVNRKVKQQQQQQLKQDDDSKENASKKDNMTLPPPTTTTTTTPSEENKDGGGVAPDNQTSRTTTSTSTSSSKTTETIATSSAAGASTSSSSSLSSTSGTTKEEREGGHDSCKAVAKQQQKQQQNNSGGANDDGDGDDDDDEYDREMERRIRSMQEYDRRVRQQSSMYLRTEDGQMLMLNPHQHLTLSSRPGTNFFMYRVSAFRKARQGHPALTKRKSARFRAWLKRWAVANVTDSKQKQCTDWLMGRTENLVPNRTRVFTDNDLTRTPYVPYNRYRVDRLCASSTTLTHRTDLQPAKKQKVTDGNGDNNSSTGTGTVTQQNSSSSVTVTTTSSANASDGVTDRPTAPVEESCSNLSNVIGSGNSNSSSTSNSSGSSSGGGGNL